MASKGRALETTSIRGIYKYPGNGKYVVKVWDPALNRPVQKTVEGFKQAKQTKTEMQAAIQKRRSLNGALTVQEWAAKWLTLYPRRRETTNIHNRERVGAFVREFGHMKLADVAAPEFAVRAREWALANRHRVPATQAMLNDALKSRVIDHNPFNGMGLEQSKGRKNIRVLTPAELDELVRAAEQVHGEYGRAIFAPMIRFAAWSGLRPGELAGLHIEDVNMDAAEIHVRWQFHSRSPMRLVDLKTDNADRVVALLPEARAALEGMLLPDEGLVFVSPRDGAPLHARSRQYYWDPVRAAFAESLPWSHWLRHRMRVDGRRGRLDLYELRHFFGTRLAEAGCTPYEIALQMGHGDGGKLAMETYIHVDRVEARARVQERFRASA